MKPCSPHGLECYDDYIAENKGSVLNSCVKNCHGIYADIERKHLANNDTLTIKDEDELGFLKVFMEYQDYKKGFVTGYDDFFTDITKLKGVPFLNDLVQVNITRCDYYGVDCLPQIRKGKKICNAWNKCTLKVAQMLKVVEIYLDTPTFDKITMDAKTNIVSQISMIGGTLGLFSGFSILSGVEILYFFMKFLLNTLKGKKTENQ